MFPRLFPEVPEDLAALGDESLAETLDAFRDVSKALKSAEIDLTEKFGADISEADASAEAMRQWQEAAETVTSIRAEQKRREDERAEFAAQADALDAQFETAEAVAEPVVAESDEPTPDEPTPDDDDPEATPEVVDETAEPEVAPEAEPVTAAAAPRVRFPAVPRSHEARDTGDNPVVLVAAAGNTTARVRPGEALTRERYAEAVIDVNKSRGAVVKVKGGGRERILVASAQSRFPKERVLVSGDIDGNMEKLRDAGIPFAGRDDMEVASLLAAGVCPPPQPIYTLPDLETAARPVRDFLTTFNADRGGVSVPAVDTIGDVDADAISVITNADAIEGGTFATKSCADIDCTTWTNVFVDTIAHCRAVDNLMGRTWPEGVAKQNSLTLAALARTADGKLLDGIDALSIHTAGSAVYGASSTLLYRLQLSRVQMISRLRLPVDTVVDVLLPFYAAEMFSLDIANNGEEGRFDTPQGQVGALLRRFGFNVFWHLDQGIAGGATQEIFSAEAATQVDWPGSTIIARVALSGTFIRLDTGTLELGVVRDSDLNSINKYQLFGELWENVARIGPAAAAHRIAITICPDGTRAPFGSLFTCSAS